MALCWKSYILFTPFCECLGTFYFLNANALNFLFFLFLFLKRSVFWSSLHSSPYNSLYLCSSVLIYKIGGTSTIKKNWILFVLSSVCTIFKLRLKIGCGSAMKINANLFCIALAFHYLCRKIGTYVKRIVRIGGICRRGTHRLGHCRTEGKDL